jgi:hypothetical protein
MCDHQNCDRRKEVTYEPGGTRTTWYCSCCGAEVSTMLQPIEDEEEEEDA